MRDAAVAEHQRRPAAMACAGPSRITNASALSSAAFAATTPARLGEPISSSESSSTLTLIAGDRAGRLQQIDRRQQHQDRRFVVRRRAREHAQLGIERRRQQRLASDDLPLPLASRRLTTGLERALLRPFLRHHRLAVEMDVEEDRLRAGCVRRARAKTSGRFAGLAEQLGRKPRLSNARSRNAALRWMSAALSATSGIASSSRYSAKFRCTAAAACESHGRACSAKAGSRTSRKRVSLAMELSSARNRWFSFGLYRPAARILRKNSATRREKILRIATRERAGRASTAWHIACTS